MHLVGLRDAASVDQAPWQELREELMGILEIVHIALIGGEVDALLLVRARDNHDLRRVVLERLQAIPSIRSTKTWLIFEDFAPESVRGAIARAELEVTEP